MYGCIGLGRRSSSWLLRVTEHDYGRYRTRYVFRTFELICMAYTVHRLRQRLKREVRRVRQNLEGSGKCSFRGSESFRDNFRGSERSGRCSFNEIAIETSSFRGSRRSIEIERRNFRRSFRGSERNYGRNTRLSSDRQVLYFWFNRGIC
jgi:hypothetical protein